MAKVILQKRDLIKALEGFSDTDDVVIMIDDEAVEKTEGGVGEDIYPFYVTSVPVSDSHNEIRLVLLNEDFQQAAERNRAIKSLDEFTLSYINTALWSSTDDKDIMLEHKYDINDISEECLKQMQEDCKAFQESNAQWLVPEHLMVSNHMGTALVRGGQDFWLTRNGHGAGFWDGDWSVEANLALTQCSKAYGSVDLYVGDDKKIYCN